MKFIILIVTLFLSSNLSFAQNEWQQTVNYTIDVKLNDIDHLLNGNIEMEYINNSPDALGFIYIHLWANAYDNHKTALARQLHVGGNDILRYDNDSLKGCIAQMDFKVNNNSVRWEYDVDHKDIAKIYLASPLASGGSIKISSPFQVKIPSGDISRLGHVGQSYQITQWYPKPAVYDKNGWHPMPYLNQGEFYSEYGSYDVKITLPDNYVVGSTGDLQNEEEKAFLKNKSDETKLAVVPMTKKAKDANKFPPSSTKFKTLQYIQSKVHDFAWFADKRYMVLQDEVELPHSKRKVTTYAMFTPRNAYLWKNASEYIKDGTYYYSLWNGDYPYSQVTAVDGTISAGGGMEYPNVTVIGNSRTANELEIVIVHEVGHNWFYGILGSNERDHGWMDEGLNTLNEIRYIQTKYPGNTRLTDQVLNGKFHFDHLDYHDQADLSYQAIAKFGEDQPIETRSPDFHGINYGIVMYQKTGLVFHYLKSYLGDELFDKCMSAYFEKWKFRHPQPEDLKQIVEETSGKKLDWLFYDLIQTTNHIDYKLTKVKTKGGNTTVSVKNAGQVNGPIPVTLQNGTDSTTIWFEPGKGKRTQTLAGNYPSGQIDPTNHIPEMDRSNNTIKEKGLFRKIEPLKLEFFAGDNEPNNSNLFWSPILGFNHGDKFMLGAAIHNIGVTNNPFQFYVAPMYSFNREFVSGLADFHYTFLPARFVKQTKLGVSGRTFKMENITRGNVDFYSAITPYLIMKLGNRARNKPWAHELQFKGLIRQDEILGSPNQLSYGGFGNYSIDMFLPDHQWETKLRVDYHQNEEIRSNATRGMVTSTYRYRYLKNNMIKWLELRLFAGSVLDQKNTQFSYGVNGLSLSGTSGAQDLFFENLMFNRSSIPANQYTHRGDNQGGFSSTSSYGNSDDWMITGKIHADLPIQFPGLGAFMDYGIWSTGTTTESAWNLGLAFRIRKVFQISFPILMSDNLVTSYSSANYMKRVRLKLNLNMNSYPPKLKSFNL